MAQFFRRKKYFMREGMQLRFAWFVAMFVFVSCAVTGLTIFYTTTIMLGERLAQVYPQGRLAQIFRSVYLAFFINLVLIFPIIFYAAIKFSHRIAGPLPKIIAALKTIGGGNFDVRLTLRKRDELRELANTINEMAARLKERESKNP